MNVLVLGAGGYTGAHLVKALLEHGDRVRGLVRQIEQGIPLEKLGMDLRVGDIRESATLEGIADECQVIFNLVSSCRLEPSESRVTLLDGARNIFRLVDRTQLVRYIWTSNVSVYGYPAASVRLDEESPLKPSYGLGRATMDAENLASASVPTVTLRVAGIYGPGRDMVSALKEGRLRLLNNGENWQSRIHVDDLVQVLVAAMERAKPGSVYLVADDMPAIQRQFFQEVANAVGAPVPLSLEARAAQALGVFGRAMNALAGERQYQLSENVIGLLTGNYYCLTDKVKRELGITWKYPTFREGYKAILERDG